MKAIALKVPGGIDQMEYVDIEQPAIHDGEVLIQTRAISINPVDVKTRSGKGVYGRIKDQQPLIIGWDVSGVVTASKSPLFQPGEEVFGMVNFPGHGKAYAEYVAAPADQLARKPANSTHEQAAAATLVALTAWQAMVHHAKVQQGQKVLIHAAAGGVGHLAVQIAKYLGAEVTGTSSAANKAFVLQQGADHHIDYHHFDWEAHGRTFDFVLDSVGGDNIDRSLLVTKTGGTVISIPTGLSEQVKEKAAAMDIKGYNILVRSDGQDMQQLAELLEKGTLRPHVSQTFPFDQMGAAHLQLETGRTVGKIVITL